MAGTIIGPMEEMPQLVACARVMDEFMAEGVNVALPVGACDIDLLAFVASHTAPCGFVSVPIQVVVLPGDEKPRNHKRKRAAGVLLAVVWDGGLTAPMRSFAFTSAELVVVNMMALIDGANAERADAITNRLRQRQSVLQNAMEPFAMSPGKWRKKLMAIIAPRLET